MSRLDDFLKESLRREDPGADFTRRVLARAAAPPEPQNRWRALVASFRLRPAWAVALLAILMVAAGGLEHQRQQRVRIEGEAAKEQLVLALRVAGGKLHTVQEKVLELSRPAAE